MKNKEKMTRRQFIHTTAAAGAGTLTLGLLLAGCKKDGAGAGGGNESSGAGSKEASGGAEKSCNDVSGLTESEKKTRESLKYVDNSPMPDKNCLNCSLYLQPEAGEFCGGCSVLKGPVHPQGYCTAWAPKA